MDLPTEISLFSGAGGPGLVARELGHRVVCYIEADSYCQRVLQSRIADGWIDDAHIWDDARTFDGRPWRGRVDIVSAGFPCQPFSLAGKQQEADDPRDLWPETIRIIREVRPRIALLENVPGLLVRYLGRLLGDLAESGYDARWDCLSANHVGAPHIRDRLWIVAADARRHGSDRLEHEPEPWGSAATDARAAREGPGPDSHGCRQPWESQSDSQRRTGLDWPSWRDTRGRRVVDWLPEILAVAARVDDGLPDRLDRLRALGNAWVPKQAVEAWRLLM